MKNVKWILLTILLISIIITVILFVNFVKEKNNNLNDDYINNITDDILKNIYDKKWHIISLTIADGNDEYFRNDSYDDKYIVISKENIEYCDNNEKKCKIDNYTYQNNVISITTSNSLGEGNYEIELAEDKLKLSRKENGKTISYYFEEAKG